MKITKLFLDDTFELVENRRGGYNLWYGGYVYRKKVEYSNSINWICLNNHCRGRLVTRENNTVIKEGRTPHNHSPKYVTSSEYKKVMR